MEFIAMAYALTIMGVGLFIFIMFAFILHYIFKSIE